jgi:2-polyprenyl-3-methyl-5-hydroxy-6-metoxy-1,4-benzoquinol methylase
MPADGRVVVVIGLAVVVGLGLGFFKVSEESASPDSTPSRKKKAKARKHKVEKTDSLSAAPQLETNLLAEYHELRGAASSMTSQTISWFQRNAEMLLSSAGADDGPDGWEDASAELEEGANVAPAADSITVLSIGCGDGSIDVEILKMLAAQPGVSKVHYVGVEPCARAAAAFRERLALARAARQLGPDVVAFVLESELDDRPVRSSASSPAEVSSRGFTSKHQFDLVLMVHVAQCFKHPAGAIQRAMLQTKPGGCASPRPSRASSAAVKAESHPRSGLPPRLTRAPPPAARRTARRTACRRAGGSLPSSLRRTASCRSRAR